MEFDWWNTIQARKKYTHLFIFFYYYFFNKSKRIALVSNLSVASNNVYTTNLENHEIHSVLGYIPKVS